ncbi:MULTISPECIES: DUF1540 domain-containing protein [unclassified Bacillus (in: firmicutes)]|uniref:DUF1540 domain-containing protein n=1 Tax=Bacillaceae TaxID=186817 RepID=UPI000BEFBEB8|nr:MULTISPECIES: DUF1540 domain-containing protein [unclassified Bacillus (in: firmicutes)]PEJ56727.1 disulfide formation protein C [Bacillus sp. AFS002410]PEK98564.1 disulfide formation protein C [Bacillus sp. AFS017336]QKE73781.1 DUF1540 domain-containing protein [Arthrobacter citreus]
MPEIRCSVANCNFWGQGNFCQADSILVQTEAYEYSNDVDLTIQNAVLDGQITTSAVHSGETCCHTFRPKY